MYYLVARKTDSFEENEYQYEIDQQHVNEFIRHKNNLHRYLKQEILHDQVIESHRDYKEKVNYWHDHLTSNHNSNYTKNHEIRSSLNRLAFNTLNLGKLYLDRHCFTKTEDKIKTTTVCFAHKISRKNSTKEIVSTHREQIYKENRMYRIGCELRNYSQHNFLPITKFNTKSRYSHKNKIHTFSFGIPYDYNDLICINKNLKKTVNPEEIYDLTEIIDGYVRAIIEMHKLNIELTKEAIQEAKNYILGFVKNIIKTEEDHYYFKIRKPDGSTIDTDIEWFSVVDYLQEKHTAYDALLSNAAK